MAHFFFVELPVYLVGGFAGGFVYALCESGISRFARKMKERR